WRSRQRRLVLAVRLRRKRGQGESHSELAPAAVTVASRADRAPVHLDERADERQPDAQPAAGVIERLTRLHEEIEDRFEQVRGDPGTVVADANDRSAVLPSGSQPDVATRRRILRRIAQQVDLHLLKAGGV